MLIISLVRSNLGGDPMPLHDWTLVEAGIFHDFHLAWIAEIRRTLNGGLLPAGFYALSEQVIGGGSPDVLALHEPELDRSDFGSGGSGQPLPTQAGGTTLRTSPPRTRHIARSEREIYTTRQRRMVIRHTSGDRMVALIEIVTANNKAIENAWRTFVDKTLSALSRGLHLLILDLYPPTARDPDGVHGSIWGELTGDAYNLPADADRTLAAYSAGAVKTGYVEPVAIGQILRDMPLFLTPEGYVYLPLEATYTAAYDGVPKCYRRLLESPRASLHKTSFCTE